MADAGIDVLMLMKASNGPIPAESQTVFTPSKTPDPLRLGFQAGQFCELLAFEFAVGIEPAGAKLPDEFYKKHPELAKQLEKVKKQNAMQEETLSKSADIIEAQPIQFTRLFDVASPRLFQALVGCETLDQVSIVKRKASGTANSGEVYLRLDFTKVLVTELEWEDKEHYVEETGTFIYRELVVRYRQQKPDGTLGVPIPMEWKMQQ